MTITEHLRIKVKITCDKAGNPTDCKVIADKVARFMNLHPNAMMLPARNRYITEPRQIATYIMLTNGIAIGEISAFFNNQHRTTTMNSFESVSNQMQVDTDFRDKVNAIENFVNKKQ